MADHKDLLKYIEVPSAYQSKVIPQEGGYTFISNVNGVPQVWKADGNEAPALWGEYPDRVMDVFHSPEGNQAIIGIDNKGDEKQQLYLQKAGDQQIEKLVYYPESFHKFGGWSPDGQKICFSSNRRHPGYFDIFVQDVKTKEVQTVFEFDGICEPVSWLANGEGILVSIDKTNIENELHLLDLQTGTLTVIGEVDTLAYYGDVQLTRDHKDGYLLTNLGTETTYIGHFSLDELSKVNQLFHVEQWDIEELKLSPEENQLAFTVNEGGYSNLMIFDLDSKQAKAVRGIPEGVIESISWMSPTRLLFTLKTATMPGDIWLYDLESEEGVRLTTISKQKEIEDQWVKPSLCKFESFDGLEVPYFLYSKGDTKGKPAVVYVHGGPESQIRPTYNPVIQYLVERDFAVIAPNVRGSKGYGRSYIKLDDAQKRMDSVKDLAWLTKDLCQSHGIDQENIGVIGRSYGGFMVLASLTHYPEIWKAGVNIVGISHFTSFLQNTGPWRRHLRECEYGSLAENKAFFDDISPLHRAKDIQAPLLVFHGRNDTRVPVSEAEQLVEGMRERGQSVEFTVFEDEGHQTERLENVITLHEESIRFFEKQLTESIS